MAMASRLPGLGHTWSKFLNMGSDPDPKTHLVMIILNNEGIEERGFNVIRRLLSVFG